MIDSLVVQDAVQSFNICFKVQICEEYINMLGNSTVQLKLVGRGGRGNETKGNANLRFLANSLSLFSAGVSTSFGSSHCRNQGN